MKKSILAFVLILGLLLALSACAPAGQPPVPVNSVAELGGRIFILYDGAIYRDDGQGFAPLVTGAEEMTVWDGRIYYTSQKGKRCTLIQHDGTVDYESDIAYAMRSPQALIRNPDESPWVGCISLGEKGILRLSIPGGSESVIPIAPRTRSYCMAEPWFFYATKTKLFAAQEENHYAAQEVAQGRDINNLQASLDGSALYYSDEGLLYSMEAAVPFPAPRRVSEDASARWVTDWGFAFYVNGGALCRLDIASGEKTVLVEDGCIEAVGVMRGAVFYTCEQGFWYADSCCGGQQQLIP